MRVFIAPDKFKGSLTGREAAAAVAAGFEQAGRFEIDCCPVADGGEGFAEALARRWDSVIDVEDPLGRPIAARCGWLDDRTAVIEMSEASGLHRLAAEERNPWRTSTFGTGQLIHYAISRGAERILVGLGGSATNDAGAGAAAAIGWQFLTSDGEPLDPRPENFLAIERMEAPEDLQLPVIIGACDVRNPLLGPEGASRVYARQKGADGRMIEHLELALGHLSELAASQLDMDHRGLPGAGAAGGLGFGLAAFFQAELRPGFALVAEALHLEERIAACDVVITGEGRLDTQTLYGKAPAEVARLAKKYGKPVAAVCGQSRASGDASEWFDHVLSLESLEPSLERCLAQASGLLTQAGGQLAAWAARATARS